MYVGIFGDVIFSVGHLRVLTPSNFKGTTGANWAEHEVLGGKARAEYLSPKLRFCRKCKFVVDNCRAVRYNNQRRR